MRSPLLIAVVAVGGLMAAAGSASAQGLAEEGEELQEVRFELEDARRELEEAAREVARLSAQLAAPMVGEVVRQFRLTGRRAMLGISISDGEEGVRVDGVTPGGPAAASGVVTGDVIVAMDGAILAGNAPSELLIAQMGNVDPGDAVTLTVIRDGDEQDIEVVTEGVSMQAFRMGPGNRDEDRDYTFRGVFPSGGDFTSPVFDFVRRAGRWGDMELVELTAQLGAYFGTETGILVVRAPADEELELQDGDVILEIGDRTPNDTEHAMRILGTFEPGEILELTIMRDQRRRTLQIELPESAQSG